MYIRSSSKKCWGGKSEGNITKDCVNGNIESAAEADSESVITVKGLKRALEVASKSVKKGKITPGQKVKNGRNNKDPIIVKRVTRHRTHKNYCET